MADAGLPSPNWTGWYNELNPLKFAAERDEVEAMTLEKRELYRFPWSKNDNPIAWLEVTDICDLHCEG